MIRVSAYPTVEWLRSRVADRPAIPHSGCKLTQAHDGPRHQGRGPGGRTGANPQTHADRQRPVRRRVHSQAGLRRQFLESLAAELSRTMAPGAGVRVEQWVSTPEGEQQVDLVLSRGGRRVALMVSRRYEQESETLDALRLVYGGFDVLLRASGIESERSVADALYAFISEKPAWFTEAGRIRAGRRVSARALLGASVEDSPRRSQCGANGISFRRMRLSRANEWVEAFERALGPSIRPVARCDERRGDRAAGGSGRQSSGHSAGHSAGHSEQD